MAYRAFVPPAVVPRKNRCKNPERQPEKADIGASSRAEPGDDLRLFLVDDAHEGELLEEAQVARLEDDPLAFIPTL